MPQPNKSPYFIPHGTTENLDFQLKDLEAADEAEQNIDLTGLTVGIQVFDRLGNAVTLAGTVAAISGSESDGKVRYTPADADDFDNYATESPYQVRWKIGDGGSPETFFFVPNGEEPDEWVVKA